MTQDIDKLLHLEVGTKLDFIDKSLFYKGLDPTKVYTFLGYNKSNIPVNNYAALMTWYDSKPIWTPEEYEKIKFNFMMIKLEGIDTLQYLKNFDIHI